MPVYSMSKGLVALCAYLAMQEGLLNFDAKVCQVWPEFGHNGKEETTIGDLLSHRAGLMALDQDLTPGDVAAWEPVVRAIEDQRPLFRPGSAFCYHPLTFGWLAGEVLRRATGKRPSVLLAEWIAGPLGVDAWIGLPPQQGRRIGHLEPAPPPTEPEVIARYAQARRSVINVRSISLGQVFPNGLIGGDQDLNSPAIHALEIPAVNAISSAPQLARIYASAVSEVGGHRLLTDKSIADALTVRSEGEAWAGAISPPNMRFSAGFMLNGIPHRPLLTDSSFGHDGAGGGLAYADAAAKVGFAYVNNRTVGIGDIRANRLTAALRKCVT